MTVDLSKMLTEARNPSTMQLDMMSSEEIARTMNREDNNAVKAVEGNLPLIGKVIDRAAASIGSGARLIYVGAGTSGRLGLLDAVECPPTFGTQPEQVVGLIAGGERAFIKAVEGAEDSRELGKADLKAIGLMDNDFVVGIAASGRTPYVIGALEYAREIGCQTAAVVCNADSPIAKIADTAVELLCGPEVLTGSTRLKAGTAQKMVLNMISTGAMVKNGKAYENLMVDVMQTNKKLVNRAENMVMTAAQCSREAAAAALKASGGSAKTAIVMLLLGCDAAAAAAALSRAHGQTRMALRCSGEAEV